MNNSFVFLHNLKEFISFSNIYVRKSLSMIGTHDEAYGIHGDCMEDLCYRKPSKEHVINEFINHPRSNCVHVSTGILLRIQYEDHVYYYIAIEKVNHI